MLPPKNEERVKSFQVKNELHAATFAVPVTISEESVESDSRHFSSEESDTNEKKRKRNNEKPQKSRKKKCSTTPGDKSLDGDNKSPVSQSPSPRDDGPNTTPSIHETSCKLFLKVAQPRYCLDTELFQLVTKKIESGASMEEIRLEFQAIDLIPESFVQCWYNPALIQCPTDKVLEGCVRSSSTLKKPCRRLVVRTSETLLCFYLVPLDRHEVAILCVEHDSRCYQNAVRFGVNGKRCTERSSYRLASHIKREIACLCDLEWLL